MRKPNRNQTWPLSLLLVLLLALAACGDDDPVEPAVRELPPPDPSPTVLMANFKVIYEARATASFARLLHPDFRMVPAAETLDEWGWPAGFDFDQAAMVGIHNNLFSGRPGIDASGNVIHPITSIVVDLLENQGGWAPIPVETPLFSGFDGQYAVFVANFQFFNADFTHKFEVQQQLLFYVAPVTVNGADGFQLLGIKDLPLGKQTDEASYSGLLALYR